MTQPLANPCDRGLIEAQPCPRQQGRELPVSRRRIVLATCVLASSMAFIDSSVVMVALPKLRAALGADLTTVQWVVNGYVLALAVLTLIGGALADSYGKARMLSVGCALFAAASAGCALAPSVGWLIAVRVLQGGAAALVTPASLALIGATHPKDERTGAIAVWAGASALASAAGPVAGGSLTETFGWQSIFWINPPIAIIVITLLRRFAPEDRPQVRRFDVVGAALLASALGTLAFALGEIGRSGARGATSFALSQVTILVGTLGFAGLGAYAWWERRTSHPMTPPRLAANRLFFGLNVATLLIYAGLSIMFFLLPFDLLDRRGLSPTSAGLVFLPFTLAVGLLSRPFSNLTGAIGARGMIIIGASGAAAADVWMALAQDASLVSGVIVPQALLGVSFAILVAPLTDTVLSSVAESDQGLASGINNTASRVAQLAGVALAAGVGTLTSGFALGLFAAAAASAAGAVTTALSAPSAPSANPQRN
jgi:EmrB/QacA subfamily drug resistance transporter